MDSNLYPDLNNRTYQLAIDAFKLGKITIERIINEHEYTIDLHILFTQRMLHINAINYLCIAHFLHNVYCPHADKCPRGFSCAICRGELWEQLRYVTKEYAQHMELIRSIKAKMPASEAALYEFRHVEHHEAVMDLWTASSDAPFGRPSNWKRLILAIYASFDSD